MWIALSLVGVGILISVILAIFLYPHSTPKWDRRPYPFKVEILGPRTHRVLEDTVILGVKVPKDFVTDGASVPSVAWSVVSPYTDAYPAAIIHDMRYKNPKWTFRKAADVEFYENLRACGVFIPRALIAYYSVRLIGWRHFVGEDP